MGSILEVAAGYDKNLPSGILW